MLSDDSSSESECESDADGSSCSSSSDSDVFDVIAEIKRKKAHPDRLHDELWYNDPGQVSRAEHTNPLLCCIHSFFLIHFILALCLGLKSSVEAAQAGL